MREVEQEILARVPENDVTPSLDRIQAVMELLGDPQRTFPSVHLTGTNGKTSTTRIVEALLREHGLTTGRFVSPHLHDIRERIAIGGEPISEERFVAAYEDVLPFVQMVDARSVAAGGRPMGYFEVLVAVAYAAFADAPVDVAVVEVGLGGSWDATNVIDAQVSVITPIGLDHQRFLGSTTEEIAAEKAGIIKAGAIVVSADQEPEVAAILADRAEEVGAQIAWAGAGFEVTQRDQAVGGQLLAVRGLAGEYDDLLLPLHGEHQGANAALAIAAVEAFLGGGEQRLDADVLRAGLARVTSPGRLEIVRRSPTVIVDAAHNPDGARSLRLALSDSFTFTRLVGVLAILEDKDVLGILEELEPAFDEVVVTRSTSPRAMSPRALGRLAREVFGEDRVTVVDNLPDALEQAAALAETDAMAGGAGAGVVATGSVTTAADARMLLGVTTA
ncbi:bifunctional folylpolyglutamate synthase/dihydrofolate synthase [Arsenicicoccus sp. oral taxon 190]|uniref:bifunctional folylpolyglutamate synthase/dihydrofolate synthase n=1 Tax=Arsenicicoccus sp. oral taxon 190 TaxID=1658671 RepID=UPI000679FBFC|nr:folylpolyglutamate synthase/dihydrofolate synthase family protein [Arsenicicoccus sp. oral taxon 190]AKT52731.1 dihydrofolate synthase [Arsenicicoccus sp. oral taxon 190]